MNRTLFPASKKFPQIHRSLSSIHNAKSFVYSSNFFGLKKFYNDEFDFSKAPLHPDERRKIRFGLKSIVDFVIQLDLQHLKSHLFEPHIDSEQFQTKMSTRFEKQYPENSFFGVMMFTNPAKSKELLSVFERVCSNVHFSQSMSEFLASEGSIETAKIVVAEAVKRGPDLGRFLRGGSFASCAQVYRHVSSKYDFDAAIFMNRNITQSRSRSRTYYNRSTNQRSYSQESKYASGFCYQFQKVGYCTFPSCKYKHHCSHCSAKTHGVEHCPRLKPTRDSQRQQDTQVDFRNNDTN